MSGYYLPWPASCKRGFRATRDCRGADHPPIPHLSPLQPVMECCLPSGNSYSAGDAGGVDEGRQPGLIFIGFDVEPDSEDFTCEFAMKCPGLHQAIRQSSIALAQLISTSGPNHGLCSRWKPASSGFCLRPQAVAPGALLPQRILRSQATFLVPHCYKKASTGLIGVLSQHFVP